jgi:hypothetical protein
VTPAISDTENVSLVTPHFFKFFIRDPPSFVCGILGNQYDILTPAILDTKRDQNSIILVRKGFLKCPAVEITAAVLQVWCMRP